MELWTNFICSWVGSTTCSFIEILKKDYIGTNLQKTWEEEFFSSLIRYMGTHLHRTWEEISWAKKRWVSICREFENKFSWQVIRLVGAHKL